MGEIPLYWWKGSGDGDEAYLRDLCERIDLIIAGK